MENQFKISNRDRIIEVIFILALFTFFMMWMLVQPFSVSPDEQMRYCIPKFIFEYGKLPHGGDERIRNMDWGNSYGFTPITSYIISALFMKIGGIFSTDSMFLVKCARFVNVLFGTATVYMFIRIGKRLFKNPYSWVFIVAASALPEFVFVNSYVNMDSMALFGCAFLFFMWLYGRDNNWNLKSIIGLGIAVSTCALSYYNTYGFVLCTIIYFIASIIINEHGNKDWWKILVKKGLIVCAVVFVCCGWWFIRNYIIYDGDILGMTTCNEYGELYAKDYLKPSMIATPLSEGKTFIQMLLDGWLLVSGVSFFAVFGGMDVLLSFHAYKIYLVIVVVGMIGLVFTGKKLFAVKEDGKLVDNLWINLCAFFTIILTVGISSYYSYTSDYQPQGRYLLPMMVPLFYFLTMGYESILERIKIKDIYKNIMIGGLGVVYVGLLLYSYFGVFAPTYR